MKNVLIINQSAELYGADKALLELIENFPKNYKPIVVIHQEGPLKTKLENLGVKVILSSVIKVKRGILKPLFFIKLPFEIFKSIKEIQKQLNNTKIDFVHSNAISVFIGAFYSFFFRKKHIWHVHEIIEHPKLLAKIYPRVVSFFSDKIIFNSNASFNQFIKIKPSIQKKSVVIHNGQNRLLPLTSLSEIDEIRKNDFKINDKKVIVIGLVGRISRLKGQKLLLKSFELLSKKYNNIHLVYIGSAPDGQSQYLYNLIEKINECNLTRKVTVLGFQENIWKYYDALDVVIVPSTEPESFGLVATEAMLSAKPVIGSNIGGLLEIINDEETGFLFESKNYKDLAEKIEFFINNNNAIKKFGLKGKMRVNELFSTSKFVKAIEKEYDNILK